MVTACTSVCEKAAPSVLDLMPNTSVPPGIFKAAAPALELRANESRYILVCTLYEKLPGTPEALCLPQPQSLLVFTARSYENLSS